VILLLCLLVPQERIVVARDNPLRSVYDAACKKTGRAAEKLEADPAAALALLDEVVAEVEARKLDHVERRLLIELRANDAEGPYEFLPYQLRGRARLLLARKPGPAARGHLESAVEDFRASVQRKAASSRPLLLEAQAALWTELKRDLSLERWAADPEAAEQARRLLAAAEDPAVPAEAAGRFQADLKSAASALESLRPDAVPAETRKERAGRIAAWAAAVASASRGVEALRPAEAEAAKLRAAATELAGYRGSFRLSIAVAPFARVEKVLCAGRELALGDRDTPLVVATPIEVGELKVVLSHPKHGSREVVVAAAELRAGKAYVLTGDMERGVFQVSESGP
jgi:hypothetical protein